MQVQGPGLCVWMSAVMQSGPTRWVEQGTRMTTALLLKGPQSMLDSLHRSLFGTPSDSSVSRAYIQSRWTVPWG